MYALTWAVLAASINYGVEYHIAMDVLKVESRYCKYTKGPDLGCYQISKPTARRYKLDLVRLKTDKYYNVESGIMILSQFKKRFKVSSDDNLWVAAYNTGKLKNRVKACNRYRRKLYGP